MSEAKMSFIEHLEELRKRLITCAVSVFVGMLICWFFREQIMSFLLDPLYHAWSQVDGLDEPKPLNFSNMLEPFVAYLKLSAIGGLFLAAPINLYQLWRFVSPGLYPKEKKFALPFVLVSTILFVGGSVMAYSMVFPIGFKFFLEFAAGQDMTTLEANVTITADIPDPAAKQPPLPETPPKQDPPEDTFVETIVDAGVVDASVPEEAGESPPPEVPDEEPLAKAPPEPQEPTGQPSADTPNTAQKDVSWYEILFSFLAKSDCASFDATPQNDAPMTKLTVKWQEMRCGKVNTEQLAVRRDEEKIVAVWRTVPSDSPGVRMLVAEDPAPLGPHRYALSFPSNPNAHRLAPVLMVKDYLSFAVRLLLAFGIIFELPIFISFLAIAGIVNYKQLISFFRYFFVISVLVGAMLTPPDVVTQLLLAMPLMVLYGLSIGVAYLFGERPTE